MYMESNTISICCCSWNGQNLKERERERERKKTSTNQTIFQPKKKKKMMNPNIYYENVYGSRNWKRTLKKKHQMYGHYCRVKKEKNEKKNRAARHGLGKIKCLRALDIIHTSKHRNSQPTTKKRKKKHRTFSDYGLIRIRMMMMM